jgi:predicted CopG family antitoxin
MESMQTMVTTINIDPKVRDQLKAYCGGGMSYSEAIQRLMDLVEAERFFSTFEAAIEDPSYPWEEIDLDDDKLWR